MNQTENVLSQEEQTLINQIVLGQPKYSTIKEDMNMVALGYLQGKKSNTITGTLDSSSSLDQRLNLNKQLNNLMSLYEQKENYTEEIELPTFLTSNISDSLQKLVLVAARKDEEGFNLEAEISRELVNFSKKVIRTVKYHITEQN